MTVLKGKVHATLVCVYVWVVLNGIFSYAVQSDIDCLRSIRKSLEDPNNVVFSSWNFDNKTEGAICKYLGIECWHPDESRVLNILLSNMGLEGEFPQGLKNCSSMTGLDLSRNKLHGNIPSNISHFLPFVINLDLSFNQFSGEIPINLSNCTYLNNLNLENNKFTGEIPPQISQLNRIKTFNVANNQLQGPVPIFSNISIPVENYRKNKRLCGGPLSHCPEKKKRLKVSIGVIVGAAVSGLTLSAVLVLACCLIYVEARDTRK